MVNAVGAVAAGDAVLALRSRASCSTRSAGARAAVTCAPEALAELTEREQHVRGMRAGGHAECGDLRRARAFEATVKMHVSNVLGKLGLRDRVQAVIYAYETGLIRT